MTQIFEVSIIPETDNPLTNARMEELASGYSLSGGTVTVEKLTVDETASLSAKANASEVPSHVQATAENDFLVGKPAPFGAWIKKTLAEVKVILGLGSAAYTDSTAYDPAGTASSKIASSIVNGDTTHTPDGNSVYDAIGGKSDTGHVHSVATTSVDGFESAADKTKLDGIASGANNYAHPTGDGNLHVPANSTTNTGKVLTAGAVAGSYSWETPAASSGDVSTDTIWDALGDLAVGTGANTAAKLAKGSDGKVLTAGSGGLSWETPVAASATKLDDLSTPDDNTDLNANTTNHGLLLKAVAPAAGLTTVVAIENGETSYKNKALFDATSPETQAFGDSAAVGSAVAAARRDHKHAMMAAPTSVSGNAGTVTNATLTTAITVDTGSVAIHGNAANTSALTLGAGASSVSGSNTGDSATPAETTTTIGALINGATAKTAPVDADYLALMDSEATNVMKKLSWAYVKSVLKTYFDGLYGVSGASPLHSAATAENDFLVGAPTPFGSWVKKTVAEVKTILGLGSAAYTASTAYDAAGAAAGIIAASISDGDTTHTPSCDAVFDALAGKAPTSSPTLTGTPAAPTAADNTATTQLATTAFAKSQDAMLARLPDQAVSMTAAASGSSGIAVADNDNIDFGTGNFTLVWRGSLPDRTPSAIQYYFNKDNGTDHGWSPSLRTDGTLSLGLNGVATAIASTAPNTLVDNTPAEITMVCVRETTIASGSITYYINGVQLGNVITLSPGSPSTVSNAASVYLMGNADIRYAGRCSFAATYNRALTAAEVLDLYRNGIDYADKWGSQTSLVTGDNSTFASDTGWWGKNTGVTITDGVARFSGVSSWGLIHDLSLVAGKKYKVTFTVSNYSAGSIYVGVGSGGNGTSRTTNGAYTEEITCAGNSYFYVYGSGASCDIDNISISVLGATLALEPEGIQNNAWYDSSSNALNASYPTTGWSLTRRLNWATLPTGANNAAAAAAGVLVGGLYRTNADPSVLCTRTA